MLGKASEIKCVVVNETMNSFGGIEPFDITLNKEIKRLGDGEIIKIDYKHNHSVANDGSHIYYETALIIYKEANTHVQDTEIPN